MTVPGVGPVVAVSYKTAVDDPARFRKSKELGPYFGLTPSKYQPGKVDWTGRISKVGDAMARTALFEAANVMLSDAVLDIKGMGAARREAARDEAGEGRAGSANWRWCCIACGLTAPISAGARCRLRRRLIPIGPGGITEGQQLFDNEVPSQGRWIE